MISLFCIIIILFIFCFKCQLARAEKNAHCLPLTVSEPSGVERSNYPVTSGVPLPKGALFDTKQARLLNESGEEMPVQVETTAMWVDESVKWLLIDFQVDLEPNETQTYYLEYGDGKGIAAPSRPALVEVAETGTYIEVNTGPMKFRVGKEKFNLFDAVWLDVDSSGEFSDENLIVDGKKQSEIIITEPDVRSYFTNNDKPECVEIETSGPLRTVIKAEGWHAAETGEKLFKYIVRMYAYAGQPFVRVLYTFVNANDDLEQGYLRNSIDPTAFPIGYRMVEDLSIGLPVNLAENVEYAIGGDEIHRGEVGMNPVSLFQSGHSDYELYEGVHRKLSGARCAGWVDVSNDRWGAMIAVYQPWQQFPKSLRVAKNTISVSLYPKETATPFECYQGLAKTHELLFYFHSGNVENAQVATQNTAFQEPLLAQAPPQWYSKTKALGDLAPYNPRRFSRYEEQTERAVEGYIRHREEVLPDREFGMRDFGDWFCGNYKSSIGTSMNDPEGNCWGGLEYDLTQTFILEYARSGKRVELRITNYELRIFFGSSRLSVGMSLRVKRSNQRNPGLLSKSRAAR